MEKTKINGEEFYICPLALDNLVQKYIPIQVGIMYCHKIKVCEKYSGCESFAIMIDDIVNQNSQTNTIYTLNTIESKI